MIAQGVTNRDVAERLQLSLHTVKTHVHNAFAQAGHQHPRPIETTQARASLTSPSDTESGIVLHPCGPKHQSSGDGVGLPARRP